MADAEHDLYKAEKLVNLGLGVLVNETVLSSLVTHQGTDLFHNAPGDTVTVRIPTQLLPARRRQWRGVGDQRNLTFDHIAQDKITLSIGGVLYSATDLDDEQRDFDGLAIQDLVAQQATAVARALEKITADTIVNAPFEVTVGNVEQAGLRVGVNEAKRIFDRFRIPSANRILIVGSDFEAALLNDEKVAFANASGDAVASAALREAIIGRMAGFTVVPSPDIPANEAYALEQSGVVVYTSAPSVPRSAPLGATVSSDGFALRWVNQYNMLSTTDQSLVDVFQGTATFKDRLIRLDDTGTGNAETWQEVYSEDQHYVRAIKLSLDEPSVYPAPTDELAVFTGVSTANPYPTNEASGS